MVNKSPRKRRGAKQPRPFSLALKNSNEEEGFDPHLENEESHTFGFEGHSPKKTRHDQPN